MSVRRVFIFWTHPLFHEAVRLLLNHPEIILVGASSNYAEDRDRAALLAPDTILFEEESGVAPAEIVEMMEILKMRQDGVRLVGLSLHDNQMRTYHRVERTVVKAQDLLRWILNDSS